MNSSIGQEKSWTKKTDEALSMSYGEWAGEKPEPESYMPVWEQLERTHYQMYETTSEGSPISPVMETAEQLAQWLVDNRETGFTDLKATYEEWLHTINEGSAFSTALDEKGISSGVSHSARLDASRSDNTRGGLPDR